MYSTSREFLVLCCILSTALSIQAASFPTPTPWKLDDQARFTSTSPSKRSIVQMVSTTTTKLPVQVMNSKVRVTTTTEGTTTMTASTTTTQRTFSSNQPLYRLDGMNGQACILLQVDALITVKYRTKLGDDQTASIYVPADATVTGHCDSSENSATMSLKWKAFVLSWSFAKSLGGERWYVDKIELTYNSSDRHFEHIDQPNKTVRLSTGQKHTMIFPTPVGKSYSCDEEVNITLTDTKNYATVFLREMKLQPFKFKNNDFAADFSCKLLNARAGRDETAPVAVGSTLAAAVLLTITGYAGWRYFKVKKVKYDTME